MKHVWISLVFIDGTMLETALPKIMLWKMLHLTENNVNMYLSVRLLHFRMVLFYMLAALLSFIDIISNLMWIVA